MGHAAGGDAPLIAPARLPLGQHSVFTSSSLDEVVDSVSRAYCSHSLSMTDRHERLQVRHHRFPLHAVSLNYLQYGAEVVIDVGRFGEFYMLEIPLAGAVTLDHDGGELVNRPGSAMIISPETQFRSRWSSECAEVMVKIGRNALESVLRDSIGSALPKPLQFQPMVDLHSPGGRAIVHYVGYLLQQAEENDGVLSVAGADSAMERALLNLLLACQPHNYSDQMTARRGAAVPHYIAHARKLIAGDLSGELQIADLARACGVSERTLYGGFRRFLSATPHAYVKNLRLDQVRAELESAGGDAKVTDIALKWGFTHVGRFAKEYLDRFGERPSQTLRRR